MISTLLPDYQTRSMFHFATLPRNEQKAAIRRLAALGMTDHGIAAATRLAVEQVRRVLAEYRSA